MGALPKQGGLAAVIVQRNQANIGQLVQHLIGLARAAGDAKGGQHLVVKLGRYALHTLGADLVLNGADKIALAGGHHHRQIVDSVKRRILHRHPLQLLVHRQAQPPANLLQLGDF